jgi:hypothetical protein
MAYVMRFQAKVFLIPGGVGDAAADDTVVVTVGDITHAPGAETDVPLGLNKAISFALSMVRRFQSGAYKNARGEVWGAPVGSAEPGNTDLTTDQKAPQMYAAVDTPNPSLLWAIHIANRKAVAGGAWTPPSDDTEEANPPDGEPIG